MVDALLLGLAGATGAALVLIGLVMPAAPPARPLRVRALSRRRR
jgi:hypothetical protein